MPTNASAADLIRLRLASQRISGDGTASATPSVRHLLALQAQDFAAACWAVGLRTRGSRLSDVISALDDGEIVRSWPMRGTLHMVAAEDLGWILSLTSARMLASTVTRRRQLELDEQTLSRARDLVIGALGGGRRLGRSELMTLFEASGITTGGQRGYHLLWYLAQTGLVCWGPTHRNQQAMVLLDEWVASPRRLEPDEALREFVLRYFSGHGPATLKDFAWWSKTTVADATKGLALAADELSELVVDGTSYWMARAEADTTPSKVPGGKRSVYALPGFDEYLLGYQDRSLVLADEFAPRIVPGNNGVFQATIVAGGRVVGTWRRTQGSRETALSAELFGDALAWQHRGFGRAATRYGRFLGMPATVTLA